MDTPIDLQLFQSVSNAGYTLEQVIIDYNIELRFLCGDQSFIIKVYGPLRLLSGEFISDENPVSYAFIIRCLHLALARISISDQHSLTIEFPDGTVLISDPQLEFESWELISDQNERLLCGPGGALSTWHL